MGRAVFPNQRVVVIHRCEIQNDERFIPEGDVVVINALRRMNGRNAGGFLLWSALRMNQDGFELAMSDAYLQRYGIGRNTYLPAFHLLEEKGFIVREDKNRYAFYEMPVDHFKSQYKVPSKVWNSDFQKSDDHTFKSMEIIPETYQEHIYRHINDRDYRDSRDNRERAEPEGNFQSPPVSAQVDTVHDSDNNKSEMNETAVKLADYFRRHEFLYRSQGAGNLEALITKQLMRGFTAADLKTGFCRMIDAGKKKPIKDHAAYWLTVLDSMAMSGETEGNIRYDQ